MYYLGVDGGGSKTRATIINQAGDILGSAIAGPGNPIQDFETTLHSIVEAARLAIIDAKLPVETVSQLVVGAGLAGANVEHIREKMLAWRHPFAKLYVTSDLHTACIGAHAGGDGAVIITGTGSCGFVAVAQQSLELGGHGFPQGDKGSGAWLGLQGVSAALLDLDRLGPQTQLTEQILNHFQAHSAIDIVSQIAGKPAAIHARLAGLVLAAAKQRDPVAMAIVREGCEYINALANRLFNLNPPRFSMIGGLVEPLLPWLSDEIQQRLAPPLEQPEMGAYYFAKANFERNAAAR